MSVIDLEPLVCLKRARMDIERGNCEYNVTDYLDTIEAALLELKSIKEAKSSEVMECLKEIEDTIETKIGLGVVNAYRIKIIKQYILKIQEQENAIEILKEYHKDYSSRLGNLEKYYLEQEKVLNIIKNIIKFGDDLNAILNFDTYEEYSEWSWDYDLAQEDFDLLKKWAEYNKKGIKKYE